MSNLCLVAPNGSPLAWANTLTGVTENTIASPFPSRSRTSHGGRPALRRRCAAARPTVDAFRAAAEAELAAAKPQAGLDGGNDFKAPLAIRTLVAVLRELTAEA